MSSEKSAKPQGSIKTPAWLRWAVSVVILVVIFTQVDFSVFGRIAAQAKPSWLLVGMLMIFLEQVAVALAWRAMLATKEYHVPFIAMLKIMLAANFLGFVFPSSAGSDVVKVVGLSRYIDNAAEALSSLFIFRVMGYVLLFAIALVAATLFSHRLPDEPLIEAISLALVIGFVAGGAAVIFARPALGVAKKILTNLNMPGVYSKLKELYESLSFYIRHEGAMTKALAGSFFMQVDRIVYVYIIALALGLDVDAVALCVFVPIITAMTMLPVSISGIGVREGAYVVLFGYVGLSAGQALSLSICGFALDIAYVLIGGLVYWAYGFPKKEILEQAGGKAPL